MDKPESLMPDGKDMSINISFAKNGVTVRASCHYEEKKGMKYVSEEYVYTDLKSALEEIPSIVKVFNEKGKKPMSKQAQARGQDYGEPTTASEVDD